MADVLTELVAKVSVDAAGLKSGLSSAEGATEKSSQNMAASLKQVGMAMAASGAAITAAMGFMGKAAIDEEINIKRLATTINNSGTAYDSVKDSMEALISTTQRKTGVADDEQRNILNRLILVTNDYGKAMELLPTVLDLAAAGEMDATTAATYLGKAYLDLEKGADSVSVRFGQASLQFSSMEDIQNRVAGSAENLANPLDILKASIGDVAEAIGSNLVPMIKGVIDKIVDIAIKIQDWSKENPELAKQLTTLALAMGIFLGVVGTGLLLVPKLKAAWVSMQLVFTASPWGAIITGIGLLIAAGILLWQNWDKVSDFLARSWDNIKIVFAKAVKILVNTVLLPFVEYFGKYLGFIALGIAKVAGIFNKELGQSIENVANKLINARGEITAWADSLEDSAKASKALRDVERDVEKLTATVTAEYEKQRAEIAKRYDAERADAQKNYDASVDLINKEYGIAEDVADATKKTRIDKAKEATAALKEEYKKEQDAAKTRYGYEIAELEAVYNKKIKTMNAEADYQTKALQQQIDAIDQQTSREELALARAEEKEKLANLNSAIDSAATDEEKAKASEEYNKYETEVKRKELLRQRSDEKDQLRNEIQNIRDSLQNEKDKLQTELDADKSAAKLKTDIRIDELNRLSIAADADLITNLARIETDRLASIAAEQSKLDFSVARLDTLEEAEIVFYTNQLTAANKQVSAINVAYNNLTKRYDIEIVTHHIDEYSSSGGNKGSSGGGSSGGTPAFSAASGGIVPGPIGAPQLATVHGGETIIPANESMRGITVNISGPLFMEREDQMNQLVDKIRKGIQREDRLRFGGAWNGR